MFAHQLQAGMTLNDNGALYAVTGSPEPTAAGVRIPVRPVGGGAQEFYYLEADAQVTLAQDVNTHAA